VLWSPELLLIIFCTARWFWFSVNIKKKSEMKRNRYTKQDILIKIRVKGPQCEMLMKQAWGKRGQNSK